MACTNGRAPMKEVEGVVEAVNATALKLGGDRMNISHSRPVGRLCLEFNMGRDDTEHCAEVGANDVTTVGRFIHDVEMRVATGKTPEVIDAFRLAVVRELGVWRA